ncbi:intraflagellar transport protein 22 homolog [Styela clava]|uniref:intraflagellar transport protein 22 homolog n=1 Tax=Styela clava TaxID=7725 RepID=UPI001939F848|nr:intraflagellar transport protein 22 homolog [Styela clava]
MFKAKIIVVGPCESGKTAVSNFLGDQTDHSESNYHPTAGVRILEFEQQVKSRNRNVDVEIELWDCSGSEEYESCWPAMASNADSVIIMYNPFESSNKLQLNNWFDYFVSGQGLKEEYCAIFAHCKNKEATKNISSPLSDNIPFYVTNLDGDPDQLKDAFTKILGRVLSKLSDSREKEELSIIN